MGSIIETQKRQICQYIYAKDGNRPHLLKEAFTDSASLKMILKTENIAFPSNTLGLNEISEVLVRKFGQTYENVYTFCVSDSLTSDKNALSCDWLVCMTEKDGGAVRVGNGSYDWVFNDEPVPLADHLTITIEQMVLLSPDYASQILDWVGVLPYPWCDVASLFQSMPPLAPLSPIRDRM
ncbi:hypothetical protein M3I01_017955 [Marinomonas sp. RSW2]|uniref:SnoaL-like domain-containing protein n=1 Tax=Marinomonas maritima TaxID=2940935 RepID=A0ABT5WIV4_9GAMM|nr:hypothetical protein [Marinomonas maritima]MDE8604748.1 hypothetical protein [Marinomonas maritima]